MNSKSWPRQMAEFGNNHSNFATFQWPVQKYLHAFLLNKQPKKKDGTKKKKRLVPKSWYEHGSTKLLGSNLEQLTSVALGGLGLVLTCDQQITIHSFCLLQFSVHTKDPSFSKFPNLLFIDQLEDPKSQLVPHHCHAGGYHIFFYLELAPVFL